MRRRKNPLGQALEDAGAVVLVGSVAVLVVASVPWVVAPGSRPAVAALVLVSPIPPVP